MSQILIAGDSWGCGEWNIECTQILHPGLEFYLKEAGHTVTNISKGGCSNLDSISRISLWFERFKEVPIDMIFIFQTEFNRDFKHHINLKNDWQVNSLKAIADKWIERFYYRLGEIAQKHQTKVYIIGGCSDTKSFDNMETDYPGCQIVCQSLTNLLVNNDCKIVNPVLSWYGANSESFLNKIKPITKDINEILSEIVQGFERQSLLTERPDLFFPDGIHPNRLGHKILYEFLKKLSII
jgi:lysophospholipase L1-like esterase